METLTSLIGGPQTRLVDHAVERGLATPVAQPLLTSSAQPLREEFAPRVLPVVANVIAGVRPRLRVIRRPISDAQARRALTHPGPSSGGVFLAGATRDQTRSWLRRVFPGAAIVWERHPGGRGHYHVERRNFRSPHIFYGSTPSGDFFIGRTGERELPLGRRVRELIDRGEEGAAVALAIARGNRNENRLTDLVFHARYPERRRAPLNPNERALIREWITVRNTIVRPLLARAPTASAPGASSRRRTTDPATLIQCPIDPYRYDRTGTVCSGRPQPGTRALRQLLFDFFGMRRGGIYNCRNVRGGARLSLHAEGRALDYFLNAHDPAQRAIGDAIVAWLLATDTAGNPHARARRLGVQEIIWNRQIWSAGRERNRMRPYTGASPHENHIHIGQNRRGAAMQTSYWRCRTAASNSNFARRRS